MLRQLVTLALVVIALAPGASATGACVTPVDGNTLCANASPGGLDNSAGASMSHYDLTGDSGACAQTRLAATSSPSSFDNGFACAHNNNMASGATGGVVAWGSSGPVPTAAAALLQLSNNNAATGRTNVCALATAGAAVGGGAQVLGCVRSITSTLGRASLDSASGAFAGTSLVTVGGRSTFSIPQGGLEAWAYPIQQSAGVCYTAVGRTCFAIP